MGVFKNEFLQWEKYEALFHRKEVAAKTILLDENEKSKTAFYIEKGCVRLCFNNNGKDVTFQFFFENEFVSSIESFIGGQSSLFTIESIEPCVLHAISKKDFDYILATSETIKKQVEAFTFTRLVWYQKLFLSRIKDNPEKRYAALLKEHPEIVLRVPQHYIASFLGITSVSLSRIRNRHIL